MTSSSEWLVCVRVPRNCAEKGWEGAFMGSQGRKTGVSRHHLCIFPASFVTDRPEARFPPLPTVFMKLSLSRARALTYASLMAGLGLLFAACGQEPGRTGLDYLDSEGVRIAAPLYHLSLSDLPVDSVFGTEVPLNHYGESLLVVGREDHYVARARMGFQISTQPQRDSLRNGLFLRLTALPISTNNDSV